jgi:membrane protein
MREASGMPSASDRGPARSAAATRPGRGATRPHQIPWRGWGQVLRRAGRQMASDQIGLIAAGCAFWATLSLFPALSMLISLYGLLFDPVTVEPQLELVRRLLPAPAFGLIEARVRTLVSHGSTTLGVSLVVSTAFALWTASTGTKSLLSALNVVFRQEEQRSFLRFQAIGLAMTLGAILSAILGLAILVFLPAVIAFLGLSAHASGLFRVGSLAVMLVYVLVALSLLYRYGPSGPPRKLQWVTAGSLVATLLWLLASVLFSFYVQRFAAYDATYGPLGTVAGIMMWLWVSAYVVLLGASLNAELEAQTETAPPKRGAGGADTRSAG